jgi:hypothetical protein
MTLRNSLAALVLSLTAPLVSAATVTILEENFDDPNIGTNWKVFQEFGVFESIDGTGIEIQRNAVVTAHSGNQYVELDSDTERGGLDEDFTNSSMSTSFYLQGGMTTVSWWYQPRRNNPAPAGDDNGIEVFFSDLGEFGDFNPVFDLSEANQANNATLGEWVLNSFTTYTDSGQYWLTFAATGRDNEYGGFIDTVKVVQQVPAPDSILLFGAGLLGLSLLRLKR